MARRLGEAFVVITPQATGFREKTVAAVKKALFGIKPEILVQANVTKAVLSVTALRTQIRELVGKAATVKIGIDDAAGQVEILRLHARLAELNKYVSKPRVSIEGRKRALADIAAVSVALDRLEKKTAEARLPSLGGGGGGGGGLLSGGRGSGAGLIRQIGRSVNPGGAAATPAGVAGAAVVGVLASLTGLAGVIPLIVSATLALGSFAALALPTLADLTRALGKLSTASDAYKTASQNLNTAIRQSPADFAAYQATIGAVAAVQKKGGATSAQLAAAQGQVALAQDHLNKVMARGGPSAAQLLSAQGQVALAQDHLNKLLKSGRASALQLTAAHDRLAAAQDRLNTLQHAGGASSLQLTAAQDRLAAAQDRLAALQGKSGKALQGLEPDLAAAAKLLTDVSVNWATLTPVQRASVIALRNNAAAYKVLLPSQKDALNALIKEGNAWNSLSPRQKLAATATIALSQSFDKMATALEPLTLTVFTKGLKAADDLLPALVPLATAGGTALGKLIDYFDKFATSAGFKAFIANMAKLAGPAILAIGTGFGKVGVALGKLLIAMESPDALRILGGLFTTLAGTINVVAYAFTHATPYIVRAFHQFAVNFDGMRHAAGVTVKAFEDFRHRTAVVFDGVRHEIAHIWDMIWNNTQGRIKRGVDDAYKDFYDFRHRTAVIFDGVLHEIAHIWDMIYSYTAGSIKKTGSDIVSKFTSIKNWLHANFITPVANLFTVTLPNAFRGGVIAVGTAFGGIKNAVLGPVRWVVNNVINRLIGAFDWVSDKVGGPHITPFKFAGGGRVAGAGRGDVVPAMLTPGEVVVPVGMVARGEVDHLRGKLPGFQHGGVVPPQPGGHGGGVPSGPHGQTAGPTVGGLLGKIGDLGRILAAVTTGNSTAATNAFRDLLGGGVGGAVADMAGLLAAIPAKLISAVVKTLLGFGAGGSGGDIVSYARSFLGTIPYVFGGTSLKGMDCSGFTSMVYRHAGYKNIPRTSEQQGSWVTATVTPQPGGLAFYHSPAGGPDPGHVAIIDRGAGTVISQGGGLGPKIQRLRYMPLLWTGIPPGGFSGGSITGRSPAAAQAWMHAHLGDYNWGNGQWGSLLALWNGECLTLDAMILTRRGWLTHGQVRPGDETIGYNPETGRSEWTRIERVVHYDDAEVWRIGGPRWHADVTPGHRWWSDSRKNNGRGYVHEQSGFVRTDELAYGDRIRLAAPADTEGIPGLSTEDAAILGWIQGDGHVRRQGNGVDARIYQSKPAQITRLRALLSHVEHTEVVSARTGRPDSHQPEHVFLLRAAYARDLLKRSRLDEYGPVEMVLRMSPDQRAAWLTAMIDAEGHSAGGYVMITQNDSPLCDAIQLAIYLEGHRANRRVHTRGHEKSVIGLGNPHVAVHRFGPHEVLERQPVWCVTTGLGTWTAQQGGQVFLTGNSGWRWNAANPSGAYGIPQSLPGSKMASVGPDWRTNPVTQMKWGAEYIRGIYGTPNNAYGTWLGRHPHWYATGGLVDGYASGGTVAQQGRAYLTAWQRRRGGGFGAAWGPVVVNQQLAAMVAAQHRAATLAGARGLTPRQHHYWAARAADEARRVFALTHERDIERSWRTQLTGDDARLMGWISAAGATPSLRKNVLGWRAQLNQGKATITAISKMLGWSDAHLKAFPPAPAANASIRHIYGGDVGDKIAQFLSSVMAPFRAGGMVKSFDRGGWLNPGFTMAYNGTGKNERVGGSDAMTVIFDVSPSGNEFDQFLVAWLKKNTKIRGRGNVQVAWGSH